MRYGIYSWFGYALPLPERLTLIREAGFESTMLWWGNEFRDWEGDRKTHPELARKTGLVVENAHAPYLHANCLWSDGLDGQDYENLIRQCIRDCGDCDIPVLVTHPCDGAHSEYPLGTTGYSRLRRLAQEAERQNVTLALENVQRPDYLEAVFTHLRTERIAFCYDSGHENASPSGGPLLEKYADKLAALHLHDNNGLQDEHLLPGEGCIDWKKIFDQLSLAGYNGALTLESCAPWHDDMDESKRETPQTYLARAISSLRVHFT